MTAKLAEPCRTEPLKLTTPEDNQRTANLPDATCLPAHLCKRDAFLGLFFDGTNNNKYRDLPKRAAKDDEAAKTNSASNVARLFAALGGLSMNSIRITSFFAQLHQPYYYPAQSK